MTDQNGSSPHPLKPFSLAQILLILVGMAMACVLAIAPIAGSVIVYRIFHFLPSSLTELGLSSEPGLVPEAVVGVCATVLALALELAAFLLPWILLRWLKKGETLAVLLLSCAVVSLYMAIWSLLGLAFPKRPGETALLRMAILIPAGCFLLLRLRRGIPSASGSRLPALLLPLLSPFTKNADLPESKKDALFHSLAYSHRIANVGLAAGAGCLILLPWMILGALGPRLQTLSALGQAASYGFGEELILRGILPLLVARFTGRIRFGLFVGFLAGVLMQPGYFLPLGDWLSLFRLINTIAIGLLVTELAVRGGLLPAMIAHAAFEFGMPGFVDSRMQFSLPHPAALESVGIAFVLAVCFWLLRRIPRVPQDPGGNRLRKISAAFFAIGALACCVSAWFLWGHPGFTEDGFLIVFRSQANLDAAQLPTDRTGRVAYVYHTLVADADKVQEPYRQELRQMGVPFRSHYLINMIEVTGRPDLISHFAGEPDVAQVIVNPNVRVVRYAETLSGLDILLPSGSSGGIEWNIRALNAPEVWDAGATGQGIVVASADTGVDWTHPAIQSRYRGWKEGTASHAYNWLDAWDKTAAPWDDNGHGTHTVGTMVGDDGRGNRVGMAPGAQWIACRNMRYGIGNPGAYVTCMEFFLAPYPIGGDPLRDGRPEMAAQVVNNSWGCPDREGCSPDTLSIALRNLRTAGILMVAAAGNDGPACGTVKDPPANDASVFSVGALDFTGKLTGFSSKGPVGQSVKPDVAAPGEDVRSSLPGGGYASLAGTSMASPHVAGLVALLWSANPLLIGDISRTEDIIRRTSVPLDASGGACPLEGRACFCGTDSSTNRPNNEYGAGRVDAWAAYLEAVKLK